jgi:GNAT superfamily N-acetyltransferase
MQSASAADLPRLIAAADSVFRAPAEHGEAGLAGLGSMGRDYPLLFDPDNAANLFIARDEDGGVLAHAGFVARGASILGRRATVACFGAVFTLPGHRGRGLATGLLEAAVARARAAGADIGLVSGARALYSRAGFADYPPCQRLQVLRSAAAGGGDHDVRPAGAADIPDLIRLQGGEPVRFERPAEDWRRLLAAGVVFYEPGSVFLVRHQGACVAYLAVGRPPAGAGASPGARVLELAGDRRAVVGGLPALMDALAVPALDIVLPPHDRSLVAASAGAGWLAGELCLPFSAAVWNPALAGLPLPFYGLNYV